MRQFDLHLSALSLVKKAKALFDLGGCNNCQPVLYNLLAILPRLG